MFSCIFLILYLCVPPPPLFFPMLSLSFFLYSILVSVFLSIFSLSHLFVLHHIPLSCFSHHYILLSSWTIFTYILYLSIILSLILIFLCVLGLLFLLSISFHPTWLFSNPHLSVPHCHKTTSLSSSLQIFLWAVLNLSFSPVPQILFSFFGSFPSFLLSSPFQILSTVFACFFSSSTYLFLPLTFSLLFVFNSHLLFLSIIFTFYFSFFSLYPHLSAPPIPSYLSLSVFLFFFLPSSLSLSLLPLLYPSPLPPPSIL